MLTMIRLHYNTAIYIYVVGQPYQWCLPLESVAYHLTVCMVKWYTPLSNTFNQNHSLKWLTLALGTHQVQMG